MITKKSLVREIRKRAGITERQALNAFHVMLYEINHALLRKERVEIRNFGVWGVWRSKRRRARNPKTGAAVIVEPKWKVRFKACKKIKQILNSQS